VNEAFADMDMALSGAREDDAALEFRRKWPKILLFFLAFSPAVAMAFAMATHAVDVPMWDGWERGELWQRYYAGELDFEYLDSPHIEHRMLTGRLAILVGGWLFNGDVRFEMWLTFAAALATALLLFYVLRYTLRGSPALWPATFLINLLLFCPQQYSNYIWAIMFAVYVPFLCLAVILAAWVSPLPLWCKTLLGVVAALVGSHSFSQGLVLWPVAVCMPLFTILPGGWRPKLISAGVTLLAATVALLYHFGPTFLNSSDISHAYGTPTGERPSSFESFSKVPENRGAAKRYFLSALGNPLARMFGSDPRETARDVGWGLLVLAIAALVFFFWRRRDRETWPRLLPWMAAGSFAVSIALLLALGHPTTPSRAVMPRYIPMTLFLVIALIAIGAYAATWWARTAGDRKSRGRRAAYASGVAAALAVLAINLWVYGLYKMQAWKEARLEERAALTYVNLFEPTRAARIDARIDFVRKQAAVLDRHGLLHPPLLKEWGFGPYLPQRTRLSAKKAAVTRYLVGDDSKLHIDGHALLPGGRIADGVLISLRPKGGGDDDWGVIGFAEMRALHALNNIFLDTQFGHGPNLVYIEQYARFRGSADLPDPLPDDELEVQCWAIDAEKMQSFRVGDHIALDR